ncbi:glycosyltransferase 87 family protein [Nocardia sp. CDC153]|uniref:glycosyltransferase 87 family protein n=1 Tax=Nocardia sp. CDC153 TaxID=3112167 RepID=UPI002DBE7AFA|nr:glycosyltransferase 87 family protein [Nocardia sp. CDC153]MEC3957168.1 glycosyltransferase 87 family protein [Nocardia sp. CDC153]
MITTRAGQRNLLRNLKTDGRAGLPRIPILIVLALALAFTVAFSALHGFLDLQVYRVDTRGWLEHGTLYGPTLPVAGHTDLPFTYPPSAAVLMIPLAIMPLWLAEFLVTLSSLACLGVTLWLVLSRVRPDLDPRTRFTLATGALVVALAIEPVRTTLWFGQINLVLMAAVALDCLTEKPRWPRGVLVGIAAVTKLTPAAFVLYFLIRRDWKAAGTAAATAAGVIGAGFVLFPRESRDYWLHAITDTNRIGSPDYVGNQSLKGMVFRVGVPHSATTVVWLALALVVMCAGAVLMHYLIGVERTSHDLARPITIHSVTALLVNAAVLLLISPVSWTHHWVWVAPALLTAIAWTTKNPGRAPFAAIAIITLVFLIGPGLMPNGQHREMNWTWWQHIPGDVYILATVALLLVGLAQLPRLRTRRS